MKHAIVNLFSIICVIGAVVAICMDKDGWGWLLFCGLFGFVTLNEE